jgi:hypothetical protein
VASGYAGRPAGRREFENTATHDCDTTTPTIVASRSPPPGDKVEQAQGAGEEEFREAVDKLTVHPIRDRVDDASAVI